VGAVVEVVGEVFGVGVPDFPVWRETGVCCCCCFVRFFGFGLGLLVVVWREERGRGWLCEWFFVGMGWGWCVGGFVYVCLPL